MAEGVGRAGWDLGGAHLKLAVADGKRSLTGVRELPCPLWQGLDRLEQAIDQARPLAAEVDHHRITMTGELVDLFEDRSQGVARLVTAMAQHFPDADLRFYGGSAGLMSAAEAIAQWRQVASANWRASCDFAAREVDEALFLDIGSTTADIVPLHKGATQALGQSDEARLISGELVYSGVTRTALFALADRVPFAGVEQGVMAELFATTADVYLLTGDLAADAESLPAADGGAKSILASERRLARLLGRDHDGADRDAWRQLARHFAELQKQALHRACDRVLSRGLLSEKAALVGAGIGRFLARDLAARMGRPYLDFGGLIDGPDDIKAWAARCAPAAALALSVHLHG